MNSSLPVLESLLREYPGAAYRCLNDSDWTIQYISAGVELLTGYTPEAFLGLAGRSYLRIIHVEDRDRIHQEVERSLQSGDSFVLSYRIVTADSAIKIVNEYGHAIRRPDGSIVALQGFIMDVTAARQMQAKLEEINERFKWIAHATNDNIWDWNPQTNEMWRGPNIRGTFALPSDSTDTEFACWSNLVHPEDRDPVVASLHAAIVATDEEWSAEYRLQCVDGTFAPVLDRASIIRDPEGRAVRVVGGVSDLTERRQSKMHLERLSRALRIMKECSERLIRQADESKLLADICEMIVETGGYQAAFITLAEDASSKPTQMFASCPPGITPLACAGTPPTSDGRDGLCLRLNHASEQLGTISIHSGTPGAFDAEEVQLLQTLAENIAFGIAAIRSREERKRIESAAVKIVAGVSASSGDNFFSQFARNMALAVGGDGAFVARFGADLSSVETVTAVVRNEVVPNFSYDIAGSPCERLLASPSCVVINDVSDCYPASGAAHLGMGGYVGCRLDTVDGRPHGLLFVLFQGAVTQLEFVTQTIQIFAARAASELERQIADARISEQASLLNKAKDAIVVHDAAHRITFWNKGAEQLYGLSADQVIGTSIGQLVYDDKERFNTLCRYLLEHGQWQGEMNKRFADGRELTLEINSTLVRNTSGKPDSVFSIITDITRRKAAENEVAKLAFTDRLTGLPNRLMLENELQAFLDSGRTTGEEGALLWIDLDRLKTLNDTRGHDIGDVLLRQTAQRIAAAIGSGNIAARFGGDEFVVLMTGLGGELEAAMSVGRNVLQSLNEPYDIDGDVHSGSASIGLAYFRCGRDSAAEVLKRADIAMYEAKSAGRNTLRLFDTAMQKAIHSRVELENELRLALQIDALHLAYQPQVSESGRMLGVEALLRWNHPTRGPISPAEFIPVAETSGLIISCGAWVLEQACQQLHVWERCDTTRSLTIAVNLSAHQIRHPGFVDQVKDTLRRTKANPRRLKLELTESSLVTDTDATVEKMTALKAIGVSFSLDDFGTGFSSLSYLRRLPLDQLKIDRSFVSDVVTDTNAAVITRSIIALGKSLSLQVIAEGVETEYQRQFLAMHGCTIYQGYLFSKPLGIRDLEAYLLCASSKLCVA